MEEHKSNIISQKCSECKHLLPKTSEIFKQKRDGNFNKQCRKCSDRKYNNAKKNRCEHGKQRSQCRDCGGSSVCEHNRQRNLCKDCGGATICEHKKIRNNCKDCRGTSFCEHNRQRTHCKDCGGTSICSHMKRKVECKICNEPLHLTIKTMISGSKSSDKKFNRYDQTNFIDYCFVENLIDDSEGKCYYCQCILQYQEYCGSLATIERIDNTKGHIKGNCVIACRSCNFSKVGNHNEN